MNPLIKDIEVAAVSQHFLWSPSKPIPERRDKPDPPLDVIYRHDAIKERPVI